MTAPRPRRLVVVTGTGTEVGKTYVSCALLRLARERGLVVAARKPLQSFDPGEGESGGGTDAERLAAATGEAPAVVCPPSGWYPRALAPPMAAAALGRPVPDVASLVEAIAGSWPRSGCDLALVEGAGGVASPLASDGDTAALARAVGADRVVVVGDPALGVINSMRLTAGALGALPVVVHLNRFEPDSALHRLNLDWLRERDRFDVSTTVADLLARLVSG